jgi:polyferredoxin
MLWIEQWTEGSHSQRSKLDKQGWSVRKLRIKLFKHSLMLAFSLLTGFTLVGYFTPIHDLLAALPRFDYGPWELFWIFFYAACTYLLAGVMREQVCQYMCPYARFQSVMFDADTLVISYDAARGEPRGAQERAATRSSSSWGPVSTAISACRCVRPALISVMACSMSALAAPPALMPATR